MSTLLLLFLSFWAVQDEEAPVIKQLRSGVVLEIPKKWTETKSKSKLRLAQFSVSDPKKEAADAELVIFYFGRSGGGSTDANIDRWISQFDGATRETTKITNFETAGKLKATLVDLTGTFVAENRPGSGERQNEEGTRMIAAILETPIGNHYLKLVGPAHTVTRWKEAFILLVKKSKIREEE